MLNSFAAMSDSEDDQATGSPQHLEEEVFSEASDAESSGEDVAAVPGKRKKSSKSEKKAKKSKHKQ